MTSLAPPAAPSGPARDNRDHRDHRDGADGSRNGRAARVQLDSRRLGSAAARQRPLFAGHGVTGPRVEASRLRVGPRREGTRA